MNTNPREHISLLRRLQIPVNTNVLDETDVKNEINVKEVMNVPNEMNVKDVMNVPNEMNVLNEFHARACVSFSFSLIFLIFASSKLSF